MPSWPFAFVRFPKISVLEPGTSVANSDAICLALLLLLLVIWRALTRYCWCPFRL